MGILASSSIVALPVATRMVSNSVQTPCFSWAGMSAVGSGVGVGVGVALSSFAAHDVNIAAVPQIRMAASIHIFNCFMLKLF